MGIYSFSLSDFVVIKEGSFTLSNGGMANFGFSLPIGSGGYQAAQETIQRAERAILQFNIKAPNPVDLKIFINRQRELSEMLVSAPLATRTEVINVDVLKFDGENSISFEVAADGTPNNVVISDVVLHFKSKVEFRPRLKGRSRRPAKCHEDK